MHGGLTFADGAGYNGLDASKLVIASNGSLTMASGTPIGGSGSIVNSGGKIIVPSATAGAAPVTIDGIGYRATGGSTTIGTNASVLLTDDGANLFANTTVTGGGALLVAATTSLTGTTTITGSATTFGLQNHGALASTGTGLATLAGGGVFSWTGGTITGKFSITTTGGQKLSGTAYAKRVLVPTGAPNSSLTLGGPTTIAAGTASATNDVQADPGGTITFAGNTSISGYVRLVGGRILTPGHTTVRAGNGTVSLTAHAMLTNSGMLAVLTGTLQSDENITQSGGSTSIAAGAAVQLGSGSSFQLQAGMLSGAGTVTGSVTNTAGTVTPGDVNAVGTLTITRDYLAKTNSTLTVDLGASGSDLLAVGGTATLGGTLVGNDLTGYTPATGATATVVTGASVVKQLRCVATTGDGAASQHWKATAPGATALVLTSVAGAATPCGSRS